MPDTYTPNFGWTLPEIGASRDTWGTKWNANLTSIDQFMAFAVPIGMMLDFAGPQAPPGYLIADGRAVSRTTYSALFAVIGVAFGQGDGTTTFALPNANGRAAIGPGTVTDVNGNSVSFTYAQLTGNIYNQIAQAHLPNYPLTTDVQGYHAHGGATAPAGGHYHTTDAQGSHSHGGQTGGNNVDHTHTGYTDGQGSHNHYTSLYGFANAAAGSFGVMTTAAGGANYYTSTDGYHAHNVQTYGASTSHVHSISIDGNHAHTTTWVGDHAHGIYGDGAHQHTIYLGGSSAWFPVLQPVIVVTKIIYAGQQAVARVVTDAAPVSALLVADEPQNELALIREQLAELRALFAPAAQHPRLMAAPLRGPH